MNFLRNIPRRLVALVMVVALAASGLSSMAALTSTLTVTSSFAAANVILTGNGVATTTALFPTNTPIVPGQTLYAMLKVENTGTVAASVVHAPTAPTGSASMLTELQQNIWRMNPGYASVPVCTAANTTNTAMWLPAAGPEAAWGTLTITPFTLNATSFKYYCYAAILPAAAEGTGTLTGNQTFTGTGV